MVRHTLLTMLLLFPRVLTSPSDFSRFVVWNVGQGSWSTWSDSKHCWHIDAGGTQFPPKKLLKKLCYGKSNSLLLTHYDRDHINFAASAAKILPNLCLATATPREARLSRRKQLILRRLPVCFTKPVVAPLWRPRRPQRNHGSVFMLAQRALITGDNPRSVERKWRHLSLTPQWLVVGHHGSRSSSDSQFLSRLKCLKQAIASARQSRYGHPHREVRERFKQKKIPLLTTEEFGNIAFESRITLEEAYRPCPDLSLRAHKRRFHRKRSRL